MTYKEVLSKMAAGQINAAHYEEQRRMNPGRTDRQRLSQPDHIRNALLSVPAGSLAKAQAGRDV